MADKFKFDVFLSHNEKDKPAVETIARLLRDEYNLKAWLDKWNLIPGEAWQEALEDALDESQTFAVFLGPSGIGPWENEEMRSAIIDRTQDKSRRVIPVLLPGAPDNQNLKLPRFLNRTWVDFRSGLDDKEALYRLYCGITGQMPSSHNAKLDVDRQKISEPIIAESFDLITDVTGRALSDNPSYEKDLLGYMDYAKAIANFIESHETEKPLTIGIDAPWGGGKTSLMRMLKKQLLEPRGVKRSKKQKWAWRQEEHFHTVWFDAWQYDQEESLWAALVLEIWSQVSENISFVQKSTLSIKLNWGRIDWGKLGLNILKSLLFAFVLTILGFIGFTGVSLILGNDLTATLEWLRHYTKVFAGLGLASVTYTIFKDIGGILLSPFNLGISQYIQNPITWTR